MNSVSTGTPRPATKLQGLLARSAKWARLGFWQDTRILVGRDGNEGHFLTIEKKEDMGVSVLCFNFWSSFWRNNL